MADLPKLQILDDPLRTGSAHSESALNEAVAAKPASDLASATPPAVASESRVKEETPPEQLGQESLQAVFGRVPKSLARRLEGAVYELRGADTSVRQQQILAALLWRYVDPDDDASLEQLARLVGDYQEAAQVHRSAG